VVQKRTRLHVPFIHAFHPFRSESSPWPVLTWRRNAPTRASSTGLT
jgi:hypothetical protein